MSVLTEIRDYARKTKNAVCEWMGIKDADNNTVQTNNKIKNIQPVIVQKDPGKYEDKFVKVHTGNDDETKKLTQGKTLGSVDELFKNKCNANGADFVKIKALLNGKNNSFDSLPEAEKIKKYEGIIAALELAKQMKAEGRFNESTDINAWVVLSAGFQAEVSGLELSDLFKKHLGSTKDFEKNILEAKSNEEIMEVAKNKNIEISKSYQAEINKINESKTLSKEAKLEAVKDLQKERRILLKDMMLSVTAATGNNDILFHAIRIVDSKDSGIAVRMARETRLGKKAKTAFSDNITFGKMKMMAASYASQAGQAFNKTSIRDFNTEITIGKSAQAVKEFQKSYVEQRTDHENGTSTSPELDGLFGGIAEGIGAGATLNSNFESDEDKLEFLKQWEEDAYKFSDYNEVMAGRKQAVQEYIQKYGQGDTELIRHIQEIEKKFDAIVEQKTAERDEAQKQDEAKKNQPQNQQEKKASDTDENKKSPSKIPVLRHKAYRNYMAIKTSDSSEVTNSLNGVVSNTDNFGTYETPVLKKSVTNPITSTEIIKTILTDGYSAAPEGRRLILVLTNPLLSSVADTEEKVNQDIRNICDAEYFRPAMFGKAKIRQRILKNANPKIQKDLYAMVEGKVGYDFDIINKDKYSKDNEKKHELN